MYCTDRTIETARGRNHKRKKKKSMASIDYQQSFPPHTPTHPIHLHCFLYSMLSTADATCSFCTIGVHDPNTLNSVGGEAEKSSLGDKTPVSNLAPGCPSDRHVDTDIAEPGGGKPPGTAALLCCSASLKL
ncbi:hypothetical protein, unlikely [Trypanosoma congolense IL3000]|uniref:Uncharacterized protein n=1 Tax=Trypanosoma congolense (strain IL3000) TaxID=1068625 RepID=F9W910_TRYCI|nr:hypothetical protein, unlikely [Trypanosoma congolense IL3000]